MPIQAPPSICCVAIAGFSARPTSYTLYMASTSTTPVSSSTSTSATVQACAWQESGSISPVSGTGTESSLRKMPRPEIVLPCLKWAASARSTMWIFFSSEPFSRTKPVPSVSRSSGSTSSSSAATCSITSRASLAAMITALPTRCVPRLANVPMQCGPVSVSAVSTRMFS